MRIADFFTMSLASGLASRYPTPQFIMGKYLTSPQRITTIPPGIPYIVANEAAERFSYYGMRTILVIFMTKYLMDRSGNPDHMSEEDAKGWYHLFSSAVYF